MILAERRFESADAMQPPASPGKSPRILLDNGTYNLRNVGDIAMLKVTAARFRASFPAAELHVITSDPARFERYIGETAVDPGLRCAWLNAPVLPIKRAWLPRTSHCYLARLDSRMRCRAPRLAARLMEWHAGWRQNARFARLVDACDLVAVTGGGFLTDSFLEHTSGILDTLEMAQSLGKKTVMFGQGFGPLECPRTLRRMAKVLPKMALIGLRESGKSADFLAKLGVPADRVQYTGDDAIEMAFNRRTEESFGNAIGVNVRVTDYSRMNPSTIDDIRRPLLKFLDARNIPALPAPISSCPETGDTHSVRSLMAGSANFDSRTPGDTPEAVIDCIRQCRIVVTGSYHAAVFALSQGIPAIGLIASPYYADKFEGLRAAFGKGCELVDMSDCNGSHRLGQLLQHIYDNAAMFRPTLLDAAQRQVNLSRDFYARACSLISAAS